MARTSRFSEGGPRARPGEKSARLRAGTRKLAQARDGTTRSVASHRQQGRAFSSPRGTRFAVVSVACVALAVGLRAWRVGHGLPELNEEAFPFRHALAMWGSGGSPPDMN